MWGVGCGVWVVVRGVHSRSLISTSKFDYARANEPKVLPVEPFLVATMFHLDHETLSPFVFAKLLPLWS